MKSAIILSFLFFISSNTFAGQETLFKVNGHQFKILTDDIVYDGKISEKQFVMAVESHFPDADKFKMCAEIYKKLNSVLEEQRNLIKEFLLLTDNFSGMVKEEQAAPFYNAHEALKSIDSFEKFKSLMGYKGNKISKKNYSKYRNASLSLEALSLWKMNFKK